MYKTTSKFSQISFWDFNQTCGLELDLGNEWVRLAHLMPWDRIEARYAALFPSTTGNVAKPARMAIGALIIQTRKGLSDRKLVAEVSENPYLQYFLGLPGFTRKAPFHAVSLVSFRKRITAGFLAEVNELVIGAMKGAPKEGATASAGHEEEEGTNAGTLILDATCAPSNIRYPQDFSLLNEAREKLDTMIDHFVKHYDVGKRPRTYRRTARKEYLAMAKAKKRSAKKMRALIRKQLNAIERNLRHLEGYMSEGYALPGRYVGLYLTILELYRQQKHMFDHKVHRVDDRIVSLRQPYLRPIVRGKAKAPTEFGAKFDVSIDGDGFARMEKLSFDPYNESTIFQDALERYRERTGHYPERVLVDKIYRTRENIRFCKEKGIRISGPRLGRPPKEGDAASKRIEKQDAADRNEVERFFSLGKRCNGMGLIRAKLANTTRVAIALSVLVTNLFLLPCPPYFLLYFLDDGSAQQNCSIAIFDNDDYDTDAMSA